MKALQAILINQILFREKFKLGAYYVVSAANKANNPMQLKFGFDIFDKRKNSWD